MQKVAANEQGPKYRIMTSTGCKLPNVPKKLLKVVLSSALVTIP